MSGLPKRDYDCTKCRRGWLIVDGIYWLGLFTAGAEIYKIQNGKTEQVQDNALRKKLWDSVKVP